MLKHIMMLTVVLVRSSAEVRGRAELSGIGVHPLKQQTKHERGKPSLRWNNRVANAGGSTNSPGSALLVEGQGD